MKAINANICFYFFFFFLLLCTQNCITDLYLAVCNVPYTTMHLISDRKKNAISALFTPVFNRPQALLLPFQVLVMSEDFLPLLIQWSGLRGRRNTGPIFLTTQTLLKYQECSPRCQGSKCPGNSEKKGVSCVNTANIWYSSIYVQGCSPA